MTTTHTDPADLRVWSQPDALSPNMFTTTGALAAVRVGIKASIFPVVPDAVAHANDALTRLDRVRDHFFASHLDGQRAVAEHVDLLMSSADVDPDAFTESLRSYWLAEQHKAAGGTLLSAIAEGIQHRQPIVLAEHADAMLDGLRDHLNKLLTRVRQIDAILDRLDVTDTAAVAQGSTKQRAVFAEFPELVARYWRIRNGQKVLTSATSPHPPGNTADYHRHTWAEFYAGRPWWEFSNGNPLDAHDGSGAQVTRLLAVSRLSTTWLPSYDDLCKVFEAAWAVDQPTEAEPAPDLQYGQHYFQRRTAENLAGQR